MIEFIARLSPGVYAWLIIPAVLFSIGLYGMLTRRNAVGVLIAAELAINAAAMNFVIFNRFITPRQVDGQIMSLFIIATAAAEVLVGIAIFVMLFKFRKTTDVTRMNQLKD
jgi:NADH:ubiquinone oxidoreductase subunit K